MVLGDKKPDVCKIQVILQIPITTLNERTFRKVAGPQPVLSTSVTPNPDEPAS